MPATVKIRVVTVVLLCLALLCYALGAVLPGALLLIVGAGFELAFWISLFKSRRAPDREL